MIPLEKCPFKGRTYFFDLRFYRNQEELSKNIKKLGGKIETFLCEEVTHVITDKPNAKSKIDFYAPGTPKSHLSVPSPANDSGCYDSALSPGFAKDCKKQVLSRGQALAQKAKLKSQGSTDIYGLCDQLKIKVLPLQKVLTYIEHYKEVLKRHTRDKKDKKKPKPFSETLAAPYIKIEDQACRFRPVYKCLTPWKNYFHSSFLRVAAKIQNKLPKDINAIFRPVENLQSGPMHNQNVSNAIQFVSPNFKPFQGHCTKKKMDEKNNGKDNLKKDLKQKKDLPKKLYCEICGNYFRDIEQHLQTLKHKSFQNKAENFRSVYEITRSLPTVDQFLKKNKAVSSNITQITIRDEQNKFFLKSNECHKDDSEDVIEASCLTSESSEPFPYLDNFKENSKSSGEIKILNCKQILDIYTKWSSMLTEEQMQKVSKMRPFFKKTTSPSATVVMENPKASMLCHEVLGSDVPNKTESPVIELEHTQVSTPTKPLQVSNNVLNNDLSLGKGHLKYSNVHVNVMEVSQFAPQTSLCDDSENVMLNINGCPIPKYPFRNFGYGFNSSVETEKTYTPSLQAISDDIRESPPENDATVDEPSAITKWCNKFIPLSDNMCDNFGVNKNLMFSSVALNGDDGDENAIQFHIENDKSDKDDFKTIQENIDDLYQSLCLCDEQPIDLSVNHHGIEVET